MNRINIQFNLSCYKLYKFIIISYTKWIRQPCLFIPDFESVVMNFRLRKQ